MTQSDDVDKERGPDDISVWRPVLTGLSLMRGGLIFAMCSFLFAIVLMLVTGILAIHYRMEWLFSWSFGCLGLLAVITTVILLWGMGICCLAPPQTGARRFAQAAFVLALTTTALIAGWVALELVVYRYVSQDWFNSITRFGYLHKIFVVTLILNGTLAAICWHRFLGVVTSTFQQPDLAKLARNFIVWSCCWATCATLAFFIGPSGVAWHGLVFMLLAMVSSWSALPALIWASWLVFSVRMVLYKAFHGDPTVRITVTWRSVMIHRSD